MTELAMNFTMNSKKYTVATEYKPETIYRMDAMVHYFPINNYIKGAIKLDPFTDLSKLQENIEICDHFIIRCETPEEWVKVSKKIGIEVLTETIDRQIKHWINKKNAYQKNINDSNSSKSSINQLIVKIEERLDELSKLNVLSKYAKQISSHSLYETQY